MFVTYEKINLWWKGQAYIIAKKYKLSVYKGESFVGLTLGVDIVKLLSPPEYIPKGTNFTWSF